MDIGSILVYMSTLLFFVVFGLFGFFLYMMKRKERLNEQNGQGELKRDEK